MTVAVHGGSQIIAVWPGFRERVYGIAIDVGSTTIAAHLCDLSSGEVVAAAGAMNPQIRFGEDLMSRVSWVMMNPGGEKELTDIVARRDQRPRRRRGARRPASRTKTSSKRPSSATRSCTTCCSASARSSSAARRSRSPPIPR